MNPWLMLHELSKSHWPLSKGRKRRENVKDLNRGKEMKKRRPMKEVGNSEKEGIEEWYQ